MLNKNFYSNGPLSFTGMLALMSSALLGVSGASAINNSSPVNSNLGFSHNLFPGVTHHPSSVSMSRLQLFLVCMFQVAIW